MVASLRETFIDWVLGAGGPGSQGQADGLEAALPGRGDLVGTQCVPQSLEGRGEEKGACVFSVAPGTDPARHKEGILNKDCYARRKWLA